MTVIVYCVIHVHIIIFLRMYDITLRMYGFPFSLEYSHPHQLHKR
uniref:Uncharacterized protein n=1 Tax=Arundo donax TaxID=35708 RepID=A0A0A9C983_ARUDO